MINISKTVLLVLVIITVAIIVALELIQLLIAFRLFPSVFPSDVWSPIITSVPVAITSIAAVIALLQLVLILRQAKAQESIDNLIARYNEKSALNVPDQISFGRYMVRVIRNRLASEAKFSLHEIEEYLQSDEDEGMRLAGLSIVQWLASRGGYRYQAAKLCTQVCKVLEEPKRAFENYQAIRALAGVDAIDILRKGDR